MLGPRAASLSGSFGWFHLADILQAVGLSRRPSKISVVCGHELVSNIFVDGDLVVDAVAGGIFTHKAFFRALDVKAEGSFTVHLMASMPVKAPLGTLTAMVLDHSARRRESNPDLFETGAEQGVGRTAPGEVFLEGWLGDYPLEDVIPALVHQDRASRMTIDLNGVKVGTITFVGRYIGPCDYQGLQGVEAFYAMLSAKPSRCFFRVERIPIDQVQDRMLLGPVSHLLMCAVVHRDETLHDHLLGVQRALPPKIHPRSSVVTIF